MIVSADRTNGLDEDGRPWFDVDGLIDERTDDRGTFVRYFGRARFDSDGKFHCVAQVDDALCVVELTITVEPHGCGRDDCGLRRDPDRGGELYYARLVCGHGDWPCAEGCRRPVHPVARCTGRSSMPECSVVVDQDDGDEDDRSGKRA